MADEKNGNGDTKLTLHHGGHSYEFGENDLKAAGRALSTQDELKRFVERIEKLTEDRKAIGADIKEVFDQAKA